MELFCDPSSCISSSDFTESLSLTLALVANGPNPFNPATEIYFTIPAETKVTLQIHDLAGHKVFTLFAIQADGTTIHKKMLLLK